MRFPKKLRRPGSVLPLVVIGLVGLLGFVALAVDVGLIVAAKNQAQNAADVAAMAGARTLDGSPGNNVANATANAKAAAMQNTVLTKAIQDGDVAITHGYYYYDQTNQTFVPRLSAPTPPDNYNLTQAVVTRTDSTAFARVFNITTFNVQATAIATHRPRDVAVVLDYSGSMNNESDLWNNESYLGTVNNSPNNTDPVYPQFGHYSSASATMQCTSTDTRVGKCNITQSVLGIPALVDDFFQNSRGSSASAAFSAAPSSYATAPGGDVPLKSAKNTSASWAQKVNDVVGTVKSDQIDFELDGYSAYNASGTLATKVNYTPPSDSSFPTVNGFYGYTQGPKYYGKTFMTWPPDPRAGAVSATTVQQFLQEWGYTNTDVTTTTPTTAQKQIQGIFKVVSGVPLSQDWSARVADTLTGFTKLQAYLLTVPKPGSSVVNLLAGSSAQGYLYEKILRLYNRPVCDWRARFFYEGDGVTPMDDNNLLWDSSGNWLAPGSSTYVINYKAILAWIKQGPCPFPSQLRAGRILYYDAIPDDVPASAYTWTNANSQITDPNQRFWKEFIDYVLGVWRDPFGGQRPPQNPACSIGPDFTWGTIAVNAKPTTAPASPTGRVLPQYMNYADNPERCRHRGWFGPMLLVQFISDTGLLPGTAHDISMIAAKLGIHGALETIQQNHPNDLVSLIMFNRPRLSGDPAGVGCFSQAQISLSRDYQGMIDALYYPPNSGANDVRPWDANGVQTPRAYGDFASNTTTNYGFMVAYNQLSSASALRGQGLGGFGRKGAQRLIVLETDGMANLAANASFTNNGANNSYYNIGPSDSITSGGSASQAALDACNRLCAPATGSSYSPGYATGSKPVLIHCIAFGAVFEPDAQGSEPDNAIAFLQQISAIGNTGFPSSRTATGDPNFYKLCTGTLQQRQDKLRQAFSKIMDDGVGVAMVR
jgi:Putative Flp pilus-assembly TadE/G-like